MRKRNAMRNVLYFALCITLCAAIGCDEPKEGDGGGNNGQQQGGGNEPAITGQPKGATYQLNEDATPLSVTVENVSKPVYQWYVNLSNSNKGGVALDGATSNTYVPSTGIPGTSYYYCVIGDLTSNTAAVTVKDDDPIFNGEEHVATLQSVDMTNGKIFLRWIDGDEFTSNTTLLGIKAATGTTASAISHAIFEEVNASGTYNTIILYGEEGYASSGFVKTRYEIVLQELLLSEGLAVLDEAECNTTADQKDKDKLSYATYTKWKALEVHTPAAGNENTTLNN